MKKLSPKKLKDREEHLDKWIKNKNKYFEEWIENLPGTLNSQLDFSVKSLNAIGNYLITKYSNPEDIEDSQHSEEVFILTGYVLEVYLRNLQNANWTWGISEYDGRKGDQYYYPFNIGNKYSTINIFSILPSMIYKKEESFLMTYFSLRQESIDELNHMLGLNSLIPSKGGYNYQYFILIRNDEYFNLNQIEQSLKEYNSKKGPQKNIFFHDDKHLLVEMGSDYYFHLQFDVSTDVLQESREIAESYKGNKDKNVISSCKSRVEFWGDEDPDGEFFNEHLFILEILSKNDNLLIYDFKQGIFFDEN